MTSEPPETSAPATTAGSTKKPDSNSSVATSDNEPTLDFDKDYFSSSLFIGDSISTGLSLYGFLDQQNVFAQQVLAPSTALDADIDGVTLSDKIASFKPKKIFVMLGTNSVGYADNETLAGNMKELVEKISSLTKAKIYVVSIPPVTAEAEKSDENALTLKDITDYNTKLKSAISGTSATFIDLNRHPFRQGWIFQCRLCRNGRNSLYGKNLRGNAQLSAEAFFVNIKRGNILE